MAKTKISEYSSTANSNTDIASINIDEGCAPSGINNAIRALMAQIHDLYAGTSGDTWPVAAGGTGSGTASGARTNLGLVIGTDVQAYDADLAAIASSGKGAEIASYGTYGVGFKNRIINGRFDVWQRSVGPVTGAGYTTADRWNFPASYATQQVANDRDTSIPFALQVTADSTGYGQVVQRIEDVRSLSGGPATLSFWAKSPSAGAFRCEIGQIFGSGGSTAVYPLSNATQFNMTAANTWQFFTVTVDMPSVSGKTIGAGSYVQVQFGANSGIANRVMTYSEVQFEKGSTATSFDYRPYGTELALCQRYLPAFNSSNTANILGTGIATSSTNIAVAINFPVSTRVSPTGISSSAGSTYVSSGFAGSFTGSAVAIGANLSTNAGQINITVSGATGGQSSIVSFNSSSGQLLFTGCEL